MIITKKYLKNVILISTGILLFAIIAIGSVIRNEQKLYISEVCTHNDSVVYDSVGVYHDFIVLTNTSNKDINLCGYSLSDNDEDLQKFVFPDVEIASGGNLMVWADDNTPFDDYFADDTSLYTGFRLSDHESVYLTEPGGRVIDSLRLPAMEANYALIRKNAGEHGSIGIPQETEEVPVPISNEIKAPVLSAASGFYLDGVELTMDGGGYDVYYTMDGSSPYINGELYSGAATLTDRSDQPNIYASIGSISVLPEYSYTPTEPIDKATIIRAVVRCPDGTYSSESIGTFWIGQHLRDACEGSYTLSIVADPEDLFSDAGGIYVTGNVLEMNRAKVEALDEPGVMIPTNYNMSGKGWKKPARLMLFDPDGNRLYDETDLISIHGNYNRVVNQKSFNLTPAQEGGKVFDGLFADAGDTLMIRTGGSDDMSQTNFRDSLTNRIAHDLNVGAQQSVCCQLFLNGEYWGCYNLQERMDESFVESRYHVPAENVNLIKNYEPVSESESDLAQYTELEDYVKEHDLADDLYYEQFCSMMDIDSLIDFYCVHIYCANSDAYENNVALWRTRDTGGTPYADGKWRYLLFDTDMSAASFPVMNSAEIDSFVEGLCYEHPPLDELFFGSLIRNESFRQKFCARFTELAENDFSYEQVDPIITELENTYTKPMVRSVRRFVGPDYQEDDYMDSVDAVRTFYRERGGYICEYMTQHLTY